MPYKDPEKRREQWRRWAVNNRNNKTRKLKNLVRATARYHIKEVKPCSVANCKLKAERHHPDYSKPLEVIWLCNYHHDLLHKPQTRLCSVKGCNRIHRAKGLCNTHYCYLPNKLRRLATTKPLTKY